MIKLRSGIYASFSLDVVKNRPDFLSEISWTCMTWHFTDMMTYGDRLVYVISFTRKAHITQSDVQGKLIPGPGKPGHRGCRF